jgi:putative membrane protein
MINATMKISKDDHARIAAAVRAAERGTSGEIRCVLAPDSGDPSDRATWIASAFALIAPAIAVLLGFRPGEVAGGWSVGHLAAADEQAFAAVSLYIVLQAVIFAVVWCLVAWTPLLRLVIPKSLLAARVHRAALVQFEALGLTHTRDRTGILLYASLAEHRAEVLADEGVYAKAPREVWDEVVSLLIAGLKAGDPASGFVQAVERTGEILAAHLPPREDDANELPDGLVETGR